MTEPQTGDEPPGGTDKIPLAPRPVPKVYRAMKKGEDGYPVVEPTASGLGVRPGIDMTVDAGGQVVLDGNGMSVAPGWRVLELHRIPKRLGTIVPGARGSNITFCFTTGNGPFRQVSFAQGLELLPDTATHGSIVPTAVVPLSDYENNLAATRTSWVVDEKQLCLRFPPEVLRSAE